MFDLLGMSEGMTKGTDIAYRWIEVLFANTATQPLGTAFGVFSTTVAFLGSLLLGWFVLVGIVSSAYSGKVLGERWHQIWAPLRVVLGFGMLVPVSGGFSSVHYLLKDVVGVAAVNLGNAPIVAYIDAATDRSNATTLTTTQGLNVAKEILQREVCVAVVQSINSGSWGRYITGASASRPDPSGEPRSVFGSTDRVWDYGDCGAVIFTTPVVKDSAIITDTSLLPDFQKVRIEETAKLINGLRSDKFIKYSELATFVGEHSGSDIDAIPTQDLIRQLAKRSIVSPSLVDEMKSLIDEWNAKVGAAAGKVFEKSIVANAGELKKRIHEYGFMAAGSYERSLSTVTGLAVSVSNAPPTLRNHDLSKDYVEAITKAMTIVQKSRYQDSIKALAMGIAAPEDQSDWTAYIIGTVFGPNIENMKMSKTSPDPVGDMITFGHHLLNIVGLGIITILGAKMLVGGASGFVALFPPGGALARAAEIAVDYVSQWFGYVLMICLIVGLIHTLVLPMLPMMMVFVMGVSWLVLFLEASIAGVLWAFAFIRMDGSEFFDKNQAPGVTLIFNLLLRPAISMLAYCGMLLLLPELLRSLTAIWDDAFWVQTGDNNYWIMIFQWLGGIVLFTWMQWHLTLRITGLIPTIADRVGHWMGFNGMHGYNDGQETHAAVGALVTAGMAGSKAPIMPHGKKSAGDGEGGIGTAINNLAKGQAELNSKLDQFIQQAGGQTSSGNQGQIQPNKTSENSAPTQPSK